MYADILIIIFLLFGLIIGWRNGFIRQAVSTIGLVIVIVLSFILKNYLSSFMYKNLPFINFIGDFRFLSSLNIILYELLAFLVIFFLLLFLYRLLVETSKLIEKILKFTIILGIPSKILGAILGLFENFLVVFMVLYIFNMPLINVSQVRGAKLANKILNSTPVLTHICYDSLKVYDEIIELKEQYQKDNKGKTKKERKENNEKLNNEIIKIMVEKKIVSKNNIDYLVLAGKIKYVEE